jgi:lysophospholipase L1-like esterase
MAPTENPPAARARRWIVSLASLSLALVVGAGWLAWKLSHRPPELNAQQLLADPALRAQVLAALVESSKGIFDSHPDADVGRVLQPGLEAVEFVGTPVSTNEWGMREAAYALPKPPGRVRVVLLGDSYVFGYGIRADERVGVFLERFLERRGGLAGEVECLHLAVGSWNAVSETEFVRRQLAELQPDLVVQVLVTNDLDDNAGVRGFGARSNFAPRRPERAGSIVSMTYPIEFTAKGNTNFILEAVDWESRSRYEELAEHTRRLAASTERVGGRYLMVAHWCDYKPKLRRFVEGALSADQILWLPDSFQRDTSLWARESDPHWNARGHELLAELLFGVIRGRELLPTLELEPWDEIERSSARMVEQGLAEASAERPPAYWSSRRPVESRLSFVGPTDEVMRQVYTGIDDRGLVSAYASLILKGVGGGGRVRVLGRCLDRPELDGTRVSVFVDELEIGRIELQAAARIDHDWPLPAAARERDYVSLRFSSPDWVYAGDQRRRCVSFSLESVALTP